jgi:hypothetical protein
MATSTANAVSSATGSGRVRVGRGVGVAGVGEGCDRCDPLGWVWVSGEACRCWSARPVEPRRFATDSGQYTKAHWRTAQW